MAETIAKITALNVGEARRRLYESAVQQVAKKVEDLYNKRQREGLKPEEQAELDRLAALQKRNLGVRTTL